MLLRRARRTLGLFGLLFATVSALALNLSPNVSFAAPVGAIAGDFSVDHNGGANYTIPILGPPGTAGMVPHIAISYTKQVDNPLVGVGFSISGLSVITRCGRTKMLDGQKGGVSYDGNDRFCLDGQRLIAISGTNGADGTEYRTERETFGRIISYGTQGSGPQYFVVTTKDGVRMEYGNTADSRIEAQGRIDNSVRLWALNKVQDPKGNYYTVSYTEDPTNGAYYPSRLDYTGNSNTGLAPYNSIRFTYEQPRPDIVTHYQAGSLIKITQRLTKIESYADTALVRRYTLTYENVGAANSSRVTSIQECGSDGSCLPVTTFGWSQEGGMLGTDTIEGTRTQAYNTNSGGFQLQDMNGDGLLDLVYDADVTTTTVIGQSCDEFGNCTDITTTTTTHSVRVLLNTGDGFGPDTEWGQRLKGYNVVGFRLIDVNGDGLPDFLYNGSDNNGNNIRVLLNNGSSLGTDGLWGTKTNGYNAGAGGFNIVDVDGDGFPDFVYEDASGTHNLHVLINSGNGFGSDVIWGHRTQGYNTNAGGMRVVDVNGDGLPDIVYNASDNNGANFRVLLNTGSAFGTDAVWGVKIAGYNTNAGAGMSLVDVNGDGLPDIVYNGGSNDMRVLLNTGTAFGIDTIWGAKTAGYNTDASVALQIVDMNGDGLPDIAYDGTGGIHILLNTGTGFGTDTIWGARTASYCNCGAVGWRSGDINGDGLPDFIYNGGSVVFRVVAKTITDTHSPTPNQLVSITNGFGANTTVYYKAISADTTIYTDELGSHTPYIDVHAGQFVISRVTYSDGVGGDYGINYQYGGAKNHLTGPGWLGFRWIKETDERSNIATTSYVNQTYENGTDGTPNYTQTVLLDGSPNGKLLKQENSFWSGIDLGNGRKFARLDGTLLQSYELDGNLVTCTSVDNTYSSFDSTGNFGNYGMPTSTVAKSAIDCNFTNAFIKTTTNTYLHDTTNWILGRVTRTAMLHQAPGETDLTRTSSFDYNAQGMLTEETVEPDSTTLWLKTTYTYDAFGNRTSATVTGPDITARGSTIEYDNGGPRGQFATKTTNALGHSATATYDAKWGVPLTQTDANNVSVTTGYDGFGRKISETRPSGGGNTVTSTVTYAWCDTTTPCNAVGSIAPKYSLTTVTTGAAPAKAYYDFLGRAIRAEGIGLNGNTIYADTEYDANARLKRKSLPYFPGNTVYWDVPSYDALSRVSTTTEADGTVTTTSYGGLTTTVTVSGPGIDTRSRTTVKDAAGHTASVTDSLYPNQSTLYRYDAVGNLKQLTDPAGNVTTLTYDLRGRKIGMADPDMGSWTYSYNSIGELISQTDAKSQTQSVSYDLLGRIKTRTTLEGTSTWTYDTAALGATGNLAKGRLASVVGPNPSVYQETYTYDDLGRGKTTTTTVDSETYTSSTTYDTLGRVDTATYPQTNFTVKRIYNSNGFLTELRNAQTNLRYWLAEDNDASGHLTRESFANGLVTTRGYDPTKGSLTSIHTAGTSAVVQELTYDFDILGNLKTRTDSSDSAHVHTENFSYDTLNRLTGITGPAPKTFQYDAIGNLTSKSDVGTYTYGTGGIRPHAVITTSGTVTGSYDYDNNGNMTAGLGRVISYTSFNKPAQITKDGNTITFTYDAGFNRIKKVTPTSTTIYLGGYQRVTTGTLIEHKHYISAGGATIVYTQRSTNTNDTRYLHHEHLGSTDVITDENGSIVQRLAFDAWGKRRNSDWTDATGTITPITPLGFTGHEMDDESGLINMNARLYDPTLGRFLTADTVVDGAAGQGLNRYTYVQNNPLSATDPTGHWSLRRMVRAFVRAMYTPNGRAAFDYFHETPGARIVEHAVMTNHTLYAIGQWASTYFTAFCGGCGGTIYSAYFTYAATGSVSKAARAGAVTYAASVAFNYVGSEYKAGNISALTRVAAHGTIGGLMGALSGGSFKSGFFAAAGSASASGLIGQFDTPAERILAAGVIGGIASRIGGGNFGDGFVVGMMEQYYNGEGNKIGIRGSSGSAGTPSPNDVVPGGPWTAAEGQREGAFYGPEKTSGGRDLAQWVPPEEEGGPPGSRGYWKVKSPDSPWQRFDQEGRAISPEEAHPGRAPISAAPSASAWVRVGVGLGLMLHSEPAY